MKIYKTQSEVEADINEHKLNEIRQSIKDALRDEWGADNRVSDSFDNWIADKCVQLVSGVESQDIRDTAQ